MWNKTSKELDKIFDDGEVDINDYLHLSSANKPNKNNMQIYLLNTKKAKGEPEGAKRIPASTKVSDHTPESVVVKVHSADSEGRTYVRCWINPPPKLWYNSVIVENSWHEGECNWFFTYCNGAYNLEEWHELLEQLRPVQNWIYQLKEEVSNKRKLCNLLN